MAFTPLQNFFTFPMPFGCPASSPTFFVYALPPRWRHKGDGTGEAAAPPVENDIGVELFASGEFGTAATFYQRALVDACRVVDPRAASLFFIPAFLDVKHHGSFCGAFRPRRDARCSPDGLQRRLAEVRDAAGRAFVEARNGTDHFVITPRFGLESDSRPMVELDLRAAWLGGAARLAVEDSIGGNRWPLRAMPMYRSVPYTSMVHSAGGRRWSELPWRDAHAARPLLAAAFFDVPKRGARHPPPAAIALRRALADACAANTLECAHLLPRDLRRSTNSTGTRGVVAIADLYRRATFCLQPMGESVSSKSTIDALLLGCIPVLFHDGQRQQWPWHVGSWFARASVLLDGAAVARGELNALAELRRIEPSAVLAMRRTIAEHAHCVHYRAGGRHVREAGTLASEPDAFGIAMLGLARMAAMAGGGYKVASGTLRALPVDLQLCVPVALPPPSQEAAPATPPSLPPTDVPRILHFIFATKRKKSRHTLNALYRCVVAQALELNPGYRVVLWATDGAALRGAEALGPVTVVELNETALLESLGPAHAPLIAWAKAGAERLSKPKDAIVDPKASPCFSTQQLGNVLRLAILSREGGIYSDLDVLPLAAHTEPPSRFLTRQQGTAETHNNAVLSFRRNDPCIDAILAAITQVLTTCVAERWGMVGPHLYTRLFGGGGDAAVQRACAGVDARPSQAFAPVDFAETREFARFNGRVAWRERDSPDHLSLPWVAAAVANGTIGLHLYNSALGLKHAPEKARAFAVELQKLGLCPRVTTRGAAVRVLLAGS